MAYLGYLTTEVAEDWADGVDALATRRAEPIREAILPDAFATSRRQVRSPGS